MAAEQSSSAGQKDLVHHLGDQVCNVELIPTKKKNIRNVVTRMKDERLSGPLKILQRCMMENTKVKVLTRNYKHVRGICTGYIVAFDKHWNLALKDVDEVYKNPVRKPSEKKKTKTKAKRTSTKMQVKESRSVSPGHLSLETAQSVENPLCTSRRRNLAATDCNVPAPSSDDEDDDGDAELGYTVSFDEKQKHVKRHLQTTELEHLSASSDEDFTILEKSSSASVVKETLRDEKRTIVMESLGIGGSETRQSQHSKTQSHRRSSSSGIHESEKLLNYTSTKTVPNMSKQPVRLDDSDCQKSKNVADIRANLRQETTEKSSGATEYQPWLTRHVNQLFVRGDNVVLVSVIGS